jgi:hypothetical protein
MSINYELLLQENNELKEKISKIEHELEETKEHLIKGNNYFINYFLQLIKKYDCRELNPGLMLGRHAVYH